MTIDQGLHPRELPAAAVTGAAAPFPDLPESVVTRIGRSMAESRSESTRRTYASAWRRFEHWCRTHGHTPLPAHPATVAAYLVDAADTIDPGGIRVYAPATLTKWVAAIAHHHHRAPATSPRPGRRSCAPPCPASAVTTPPWGTGPAPPGPPC